MRGLSGSRVKDAGWIGTGIGKKLFQQLGMKLEQLSDGREDVSGHWGRSCGCLGTTLTDGCV